MKTNFLIMAGGSGTRFFPLSKDDFPKQFLSLFSNKPMILETFERILPLTNSEDIYISTNIKHKELTQKYLPTLKPENLILEPIARNTAPALGLACLKALQNNQDAIIVSLHSDHLIKKEAHFLTILKAAILEAKKNKIITLGIKPDYPETGYGYIEIGHNESKLLNNLSAFNVLNFKEKPDLKTAKEYIANGNYFWNAGMFIFKASFMLEQFEKYANSLYLGLKKLEPYLNDMQGLEFKELFSTLEAISIDVAIIEKSDLVSVIPCDIGWSDVGSFLSLYSLSKKDQQNNALIGHNLISQDSLNNLIYNQNKLKKVALIGVNNLMVIDTNDFLLVGNLANCQDIKSLINKL